MITLLFLCKGQYMSYCVTGGMTADPGLGQVVDPHMCGSEHLCSIK